MRLHLYSTVLVLYYCTPNKIVSFLLSSLELEFQRRAAVFCFLSLVLILAMLESTDTASTCPCLRATSDHEVVAVIRRKKRIRIF